MEVVDMCWLSGAIFFVTVLGHGVKQFGSLVFIEVSKC